MCFPDSATCLSWLDTYLNSCLAEHEFNVWDKQASLPATLDVVRAWYASTDGDFRIEAPSRGLLPKRLLHVGSLEEPTLKLVETATTANFTGPYFTLSHCWGSGIQQRLTEGNYDAFSSSIPVETLSQTFQDAIYIVRFLGVAYLWIDALCIIQDSAPDWNEQAPLMAQIYGNASCCIAATRAADGEGLFSKQQTPFEIRCQWPDEGLDGLFYGEVLPEFDRIVLDSPLNRRAWVFQVRFSMQILVAQLTAYAGTPTFSQDRSLRSGSYLATERSRHLFHSRNHARDGIFSSGLPNTLRRPE